MFLRTFHLGHLLTAALCLTSLPREARAETPDASKTGTPDASKTEIPDAGVELFITPSLKGSWRMELVNNGPAPVRLLADARLLWFEVITAPEPPDPKKKAPKAQAFPRGKIPICRPPAELRPENEFEQRALLLKPGERYSEDFDPMLLCGAGKLMAGLKPGAMVYPSYGYLPPPRKKWGKKKEDKNALPPPPYVIDSVTEPRTVKPVRTLEAPGFVLSSYEPPPEPPKEEPDAPKDQSTPPSPPPPVVDERAPRLKLTATSLVDASNVSAVAITVTLKNEGHRPALLHFRNDNVGFLVTKPTGELARCNQGERNRAPARDFFETLRPGGRRSTTIRLQEFCPVGLFDRPGIYKVQATADIHQNGDAFRLPAMVAALKAEEFTRLRVRTGPLPYHDTGVRLPEKNRSLANDADSTEPPKADAPPEKVEEKPQEKPAPEGDK